MLPVVSYLGPAIINIITGSVIIEQIFGIPGIGRYFVQAALNRDYTLVMGVTVFYGVLIILANLAVDLIYGLLDPQASGTTEETMTVTAFPPTVSPAEEIKGRSLWSDAWRRLLHNKAAVVSIVLLLVITLASIFGATVQLLRL